MQLATSHMAITQAVQITNPRTAQELVDFMNKFLIVGGECMSFELGNGYAFLNFWEVKNIEKLRVTHCPTSLTVPVNHLEKIGLHESLRPPAYEPYSGGYTPSAHFIQMRTTEFEERYKAAAEHVYAHSEFAAIREEPWNEKECFEHIKSGIIRHEAIHALVKVLFPHLSKASDLLRDQKYVSSLKINVPYFKHQWKINGNFSPLELDEMLATSVDLAGIPKYGAFRLWTYLKSSHKDPVYRFVTQFLLRTLIENDHLPGDLRVKVQAFLKGGSFYLDDDDIDTLCAQAKLRTEKVNQIGKRMWDLAFELFRQAEEDAKKK